MNEVSPLARSPALDFIDEAQGFIMSGDPTNAYASYLKAARVDATIPEVWVMLGEALAAAKKYSLAEIMFRKALALKETAQMQMALGNTIAMTPNIFDAEPYYLRSIELDPSLSKTWYGLAYLYMMINRLDEAIECNNKSKELADEHIPDIVWLNGLIHLFRREWTAGFRDYGARLEMNRPSWQPNMPMWNGEDLNDKHLYIFCEQGFGDILQFLRFLKYLPPCRKTLMVPKEMRRLIEPNFAADDITFVNGGLEGNIKADYCLPLCSIPQWLAETRGDDWFSHHIYDAPYITKINVTPKIAKPRGCRLAVGVVWAGDPNHQNDALRSSAAKDFVEALALPGVELYSLQVGGQLVDPTLIGDVGVMHNMSMVIRDFADTAAIVAQLDCVVCVDTSVAHLCGAMGKTAHVMIPYGAVDWRWTHGDTTPWYSSLVLYRQQRNEAWASVLRKIATRL